MTTNLTEERALKVIIGLIAGITVIVGAVVVFALAGGDDAASDETNNETSTESAPSPTTAAPQTPPTTGAEIETDNEAQADANLDPTPSTVEATTSSAECLVGRWMLDSDAFLDAVFAAAAPDVQTQATFEYGGGTYALDIDPDLSYESQRTDWEMVIITDEGTVFSTFNGGQTGTVAVSGDSLTWNDETAATTIKLEVEIGGTRQEIPVAGDQVVSTLATSGNGSYSCAGDILTAVNEGITTTWNREGSGS